MCGFCYPEDAPGIGPVDGRPSCFVCGWAEDLHEQATHPFVPEFADLDEANAAIRRVLAEVRDWPAADFWHRDAVLRAIRGEQ